METVLKFTYPFLATGSFPENIRKPLVFTYSFFLERGHAR